MVEKADDKPEATNWYPTCGAEMILVGVLPRTCQSAPEAVFLCTRCDCVERSSMERPYRNWKRQQTRHGLTAILTSTPPIPLQRGCWYVLGATPRPATSQDIKMRWANMGGGSPGSKAPGPLPLGLFLWQGTPPATDP